MTEHPPEQEPVEEEVSDVSCETSLEDQLKKYEDELAQEKDKALRAYAEMENFKRRKEQEFDNFRLYVQEKSVLEMLPILDSFDRACEHLSAEDAQAEGFLLIQKQFHSVLERWGVAEINTQGEVFDPHLHQAVMEEEVADVASGIITKEMQKGYKLHEKVIRPSMVAVSK